MFCVSTLNESNECQNTVGGPVLCETMYSYFWNCLLQIQAFKEINLLFITIFISESQLRTHVAVKAKYLKFSFHYIFLMKKMMVQISFWLYLLAILG